MSDHTDSGERGREGHHFTSTRRTFLSAAALGGATAGFGRLVAQNGGPREFELGGETAGWVGREPAAIEGETNPTLTLTAGVTYAVTWENVDAAPHNFTIEDANGDQVIRSEIISEAGATQTVEFTASEEMAAYFCEVHPNSMRGTIEIVEATATPTDTPTPTDTATPAQTDTETPEDPPAETETPEDEPEETETPEDSETPDGPAFHSNEVEEHRGDVARFTVSTGEADELGLVLGSDDVNYSVSFTAVDGNDDGVVTVAVDTFVAGRSEESGVSAEAGADEIRDYRQETPLLETPLDVATYPIELYADGELVDLAVLSLLPRETRGARSGVAPRTANPDRRQRFLDAFSARDEVAMDDWGGVEFKASGIYAAFDGGDAFTDESLGYELTVEQTEVVNAEPERVPLDDVRFVVVAAEDRFLAAVDSSDLEVEETYEATFALTDANPYVPEGDREEASTQFTVVERTASFDAEEPLEVPPGEATLAGTTTVAPGTTVTVSAMGTRERRFLRNAEATVDEDGAWSVTLDFSDIEPGTGFTAEVVGLSDAVDGEVRSGASAR